MNTWAEVRRLERQLPSHLGKLNFLSAGQDKDGDNVFVVGWQLWKENRVREELIPYLKNLGNLTFKNLMLL